MSPLHKPTMTPLLKKNNRMTDFYYLLYDFLGHYSTGCSGGNHSSLLSFL